MTTGEKLTQLRKQNNLTQEQLADLLEVSRQSVSKWESDIAYPETEKLIKLSELYHVCVDYLLKDVELEAPKHETCAGQNESQNNSVSFNPFTWHYERKSKRMVGNLPLWHINLGFGRTAKGVFAIGFKSIGIFSVGLLSLGVFSAGLLALGIFALGCLGLGIIALGSIVIGLMAFGAISIGVFSCGAIAVGNFSIGALAYGQYFAIGDTAYGMIAIGKTTAEGTYTATTAAEASYEIIKQMLEENVPGIWSLFRKICEAIVR